MSSDPSQTEWLIVATTPSNVIIEDAGDRLISEMQGSAIISKSLPSTIIVESQL